jgi:hypothetical protein
LAFCVLEKIFSLRNKFAEIDSSISTQAHQDKSLFEILMFLSLDSNNASALYCLRADTVFRQVQVEMAAQKPSAIDLHGSFDIGQQVPERDK